MDKNIKSVPQRKLLRDVHECLLPFALERRVRGMRVRRDERKNTPVSPDDNAKALRHLLVQYKDSVCCAVCQFCRKKKVPKNQNTTSCCKERGGFLSRSKERCAPQTLRVTSWCDLSEV